MQVNSLLQLHPEDTVGVSLRPIERGDTVAVSSAGETSKVTVKEAVPVGHKVALRNIAEGEIVFKYGWPIGHATTDIAEGAWVHSHNLKTNLSGKLDYQYQPSPVSKRGKIGGFAQPARNTFEGYIRENGDIGIRNEIWIINTVGCINKTAERLAHMANEQLAGRGIDGVYHFAHPYGCSQLGDDLLYTQKLLAGLVRHPNAAGVLVLGLGCENNRIDVFKPLLSSFSERRVKFLNVQGVEDEFQQGLEQLAELAAYAGKFKRVQVPVSRLRVGLKCGGSDGFSGITGNPLVGAVSDLLVEQGAGTLLTEVPEMFGAEELLMKRAKDESTFRKLVSLINNFKDYYARHNQVIYENPSPGNKDGGITTLEEKSLGCVQKGGSSQVTDILPYSEPATQPGLNLVQAPGNDMVSVTALVAAGAHLVLFTTGRGTPMGGAVPTLKIATNSMLAQRKPRWVDFDAGRLLNGTSMAELADDLYALIVATASGKYLARNEQNDFREIAIFKDGVTL